MTVPFYAPPPTADAAPPAAPGTGPYEPPVERRPLGKTGQPIRALAFSAGLFDTAMQLGVAHALLVSRAEPPDIAVGVSLGAVNAVAVGEILQAGANARTEHDQLEAQVARFREVLEAYRQSRDDFVNALLPDVYQVDAQRPLEPTQLPIHNTEERKQRREAAGSRAGLIRLTNDIFRVDISIASMTRAARAILGLRAAGAIRSTPKRMVVIMVELSRLWRTIAVNAGKLALLGSRLVRALIAPAFDRAAEALASPALQQALQGGVLGKLRIDALARMMSSFGSGRHSGGSAGSLVFGSRVVRAVIESLRWLVGLGMLAPIVVLPPAGLILGGVSLADVLAHAIRAVGANAGMLSFLDSVRLSMPLHWGTTAAIGVAVEVAVALYALAVVAVIRGIGIERILRVYQIDDSILDPHPLRSWFVRVFDPHYYGRIEMADVVESAFTGAEPAPGPRAPKTLRDYDRGSPAIHVRPMAANVQTGKLEVLPDDASVVSSLLAATAYPPFFQAQDCNGTSYVDGAVVANEPTRALLAHLTPLANDDSTSVDIYPVTSLPIGGEDPAAPPQQFTGAVEIAERAYRLQSLRDATLDRRTTMLVARMLPGDKATWWPGRERGASAALPKFLRAGVYPIELDATKSLNDRLFAARTVADRRALIAEAVADGCRSSLEVMLHQNLANADGPSVKCRAHLESRVAARGFLPGSGGAADGPGLPEVCGVCAIRGGAVPVSQSLTVPKKRRVELPLWPAMGETIPVAPTRRPSTRGQVRVGQSDPNPNWPIDRATLGLAPRRDGERPTINLLFSGGVFRGVYLAGVINALNETRTEPDLIAGSSVGSITAAMAARVFAVPVSDTVARRRRIVDMAATYLAIDRLVLTDRFADFVRSFTLRAAAAEFSLRDFDTALRAFDRPSTSAYGRDIRRVLAGLERLFYVSPFEVADIVRAFRMQEYDDARALAERYAQEWLERGAVGIEILGAEPLAILIREHVLDDTSTTGADPGAGFVELLRDRGIQFIATATNLTRSRLDTLHLPPVDDAGAGTRLIETLLASSAFPAVFRPRWTWEVNPETPHVEQYIDGGVMDNLPLDAVANFLNDARNAYRLPARPPGAPHLIFTGSLEVARAEITDRRKTQELAGSWRRTRKRAREMTYNLKIDGYARTQDKLRKIYHSVGADQAPYEPLDLAVVVVKPKWLCGTFAFHPMLGFRRQEQAKSIAHGCKTALQRLATLCEDRPAWVKAWGMVPPQGWNPRPDPAKKQEGHCWYREGVVCPFSQQGQREADGDNPIKPETRRALESIYVLCGRESTHEERTT